MSTQALEVGVVIALDFQATHRECVTDSVTGSWVGPFEKAADR